MRTNANRESIMKLLEDRIKKDGIVKEGNVIRNKMIDVIEPLSEEMMLKLNLMLNTQLSGMSMDEISLSMITGLKV